MKIANLKIGSLAALMTMGLGLAARAQSPAGPVEDLSEQSMRVLVQIRPDDFRCEEAHDGGFGQRIPGRIHFGPRDGDTGWWRNKITDYDERLTRIESFSKTLDATETCADYAGKLPRRNEYLEFVRRVTGQGLIWRDHARGQITETVVMKLSSGVELVGKNLWTDWIVPPEQWNPEISFDNGLINEFARFEQSSTVTGFGVGGFSCRTNDGRTEMVYRLGRSENVNVRELRRVYANLNDCWDAVTAITQSLEAQGRTWLNLEHDVHRSLWTTFRRLVFSCDTIRAERLETEIEGVKLVGTAFIPLREGSHECRP